MWSKMKWDLFILDSFHECKKKKNGLKKEQHPYRLTADLDEAGIDVVWRVIIVHLFQFHTILVVY